MYITYSKETIFPKPVIRTFQRRECLPMLQDIFWQIDSGMVRTMTVYRDGTVSTLGLWGAGDIIGYSLAGIESYQIECLCEVQLYRLQIDDCSVLNQVMQSHIHQSQTFLMIRHGSMQERFQQFLLWLANKFGQKSEDGYYIPNRLTHKDIAEVIGTTRATVTHLIGQFERQGLIRWSRKSCWLCCDLDRL